MTFSNKWKLGHSLTIQCHNPLLLRLIWKNRQVLFFPNLYKSLKKRWEWGMCSCLKAFENMQSLVFFLQTIQRWQFWNFFVSVWIDIQRSELQHTNISIFVFNIRIFLGKVFISISSYTKYFNSTIFCTWSIEWS